MRGPDKKLIRIARKLRVNQTDAETVLWNRIRNRQIDGHKFVRQEPIGDYVCDSFAAKGFWLLKWTADSTVNLL